MDWSGGLWQACFMKKCFASGDEFWLRVFFNETLHTARACMILVCIFAPFGVGCLLYIVIKNKFEPQLLWIAKILCILSFLLGLIGMATGIRYFKSVTPEWKSIVTFSLGEAARDSIAGVIVNLLGTLIACIIQPK